MSLIRYYLIPILIMGMFGRDFVYMMFAPDIPYFDPPKYFYAFNTLYYITGNIIMIAAFWLLRAAQSQQLNKAWLSAAIFYKSIKLLYHIIFTVIGFEQYFKINNSRKLSLILSGAILIIAMFTWNKTLSRSFKNVVIMSFKPIFKKIILCRKN